MYQIMENIEPTNHIDCSNGIVRICDNLTVTTEDIECPICFDTIYNDEAKLLLDCCRKITHLKCIMTWYSTHPKNKLCFMCNQTNNFCKDLVYSVSEEYQTNINHNSDAIVIPVGNVNASSIIVPSRRDWQINIRGSPNRGNRTRNIRHPEATAIYNQPNYVDNFDTNTCSACIICIIFIIFGTLISVTIAHNF